MEKTHAIILVSYWIVSMAVIIVWLKTDFQKFMTKQGDSPLKLVLFAPVVFPFLLLVWAFVKLDDWLKTPLKKHALPPSGDPDLEEASKE